jgi:predicted small secreted protein
VPRFASRLGKFDTAKAYSWKVVGFVDSTSATLTSMPKINADSDFKPGQQPCIFTLAAVMPDISKLVMTNPIPGPGTGPVNDFTDNDNDAYPSWLEKALGTNPMDAASKPDMLIDSDKDGIADFFETMFKTAADSASSKPADANNNHVPDTLEKAATWDVRLNKDSDGDGWADELEMLLRSDAWNKTIVPQTYAKGAAPTGSYSGKFFVQADGQEYNIAITIYTDTATKQSKAIIDSSGLNIIRTGVGVNLTFMFGEWTFYYPIIAGANTGKYLKFRAMPGYNMIEGAVDVSDMVGGGGPYIGRFKAAVGGITGSISGGGNTGTTTVPGTGTTVNINQAPQAVTDLLTTTSSDAQIVNLTITKSTMLQATLSLAGGAALTSMEAMWQPQMYPMFIFRFKDTAKKQEVRLEGAVMKTATGALILSGEILMNNMRTHTFAVSCSSATASDPAGIWRGNAKAATGPMPGPGSSGPLAFIGSKDSVYAALLVTQNLAMNIKDSSLSLIRTVWMEGVMKCKDSSGKQFQVLEKPNTPQSVFIGKDKSGNPVVLVMPDGGTSTIINPPQTQMTPFTGALADIQAALTASANMVRVMTPAGMMLGDMPVNPATLKKAARDPAQSADSVFEIKSMNDPAKGFYFVTDVAGGKLIIKDGKPIVLEAGFYQPPQPTLPKAFAPFKGEMVKIKDALMACGNSVQVADPAFKNFTGEQVDAMSLKAYTDSTKPGIVMAIAQNKNNPAKTYLFMADSATGMIALQGNQPIVIEITGATPPPQSKTYVAFQGAPSQVQTALQGSYEWVMVFDTTTKTSRSEPVNVTSLRTVSDSAKPGVMLTIVNLKIDATTTYLFVAPSTTPAQLALDGNRPVVIKIVITGKVTQAKSSYIPYTGPLPQVQNALYGSGNSVRVLIAGDTTGKMIDAPVDVNTIITFKDTTVSSLPLVKVRDKNDVQQYYMFLADSMAGAGMLGMQNGKPVVSALARESTPPVVTKSYIPYKGAPVTIQTALTNAMNNVQVADPAFTTFVGEMVDPASVKSFVDTVKHDTMFVVSNKNDANKKYVFMADSATGQLALQGGRPMVIAFGTTPIQPGTKVLIKYTGAVPPVDSVLKSSFGLVRVLAPNGTTIRDANVDMASLKAVQDSAKFIVQVKDKFDATRLYTFMADSATGKLALENGKLVVSETTVITQPTTTVYKAFKGSITDVKTALIASAGNVQVGNTGFTMFSGEMVDTASVKTYVDSAKGETLIIVSNKNDANKRYVFMADSATGKVALKGTSPVVVFFSGTTQPPVTVSYKPFKGAITVVQTALTTSAFSVQVATANYTSFSGEMIEITSLKKYADSAIVDSVIIASNKNDANKKYMFMADSATGNLALKGTIPMVVSFGGGTQPPVQVKIVKYTGALSTAQSALSAASWTVRVLAPNGTTIRDASVRQSSLKQVPDSANPVMVCQVTDLNDTLRLYYVAADSATGQIALENGKPKVFEKVIAPTQPPASGKLVAFTGSMTDIRSALAASTLKAMALRNGSTTPIQVFVDTATLRALSDSAKPGVTFYQIREAAGGDTTKFYQFMADSATGDKVLAKSGGMPLIVQIMPPPQGTAVSMFRGVSDSVKNVIDSAGRVYFVKNDADTARTIITLVQATITSIPDPKDSLKTLIIGLDGANRKYVFLANPANPLQVRVQTYLFVVDAAMLGVI